MPVTIIALECDIEGSKFTLMPKGDSYGGRETITLNSKLYLATVTVKPVKEGKI